MLQQSHLDVFGAFLWNVYINPHARRGFLIWLVLCITYHIFAIVFAILDYTGGNVKQDSLNCGVSAWSGGWAEVFRLKFTV
jgi:hypothetical protein